MERATTNWSPSTLWAEIRGGRFRRHTSGVCSGYAQANLVVLPKHAALDFLIFCQRNPRPCPLLDVLEPGETAPPSSPSADIRTDIPGYRIFRDGALTDEREQITELWQADWVSFLLGCSFTFEWALLEAGIPLRHVQEGKNVAMYNTGIVCRPAGMFSGNMVVSMRPIPAGLIPQVVQICSRFPSVHGAPIHVGDPAAIGIHNLAAPDYGEAVTVERGELPVFWACGVTPQLVAIQSRPPIMVTHAPGCMFVTEIPNQSLAR